MNAWWGFVLVVAALALYARCWQHAFIDYDDLAYIVNNPHVHTGLEWDNIRWAFLSRENQNWMPVARWSMQLDCDVWGVQAGAHHAMSSFWHGLAAAALLWALRELTGRDGLSLWVALVFLVHPLQVEAVAWAASRKHLLSGLWAFVALGCWCRWWRGGSGWMLAAVFGAWALSLAAKQTMAGWPLVMFLATKVVPGRPRSMSCLVRVWGGLGLMACLAAAVAMWALRWKDPMRLSDGSAMEAIVHFPVSFAECLRGFFVPSGFNYLHLLPSPVAMGPVLLSAGLLGALSWLAWRLRRIEPLVGVGWLWFVICYGPTSGVVPFGPQGWAERFAYAAVPGLALAVAAAFGLVVRKTGAERGRWITAVPSTMALVLAAWLTVRQQEHWRDSRAVFERALDVNMANGYARFHLAAWIEKQGQESEAMAHYRQATVVAPGFMPARYNLACALMRRREPQEALEMILPVAQSLPEWAEAQLVLANASYETGDLAAALDGYEAAARLNPALVIAAKNAAVLRERLSATGSPNGRKSADPP